MIIKCFDVLSASLSAEWILALLSLVKERKVDQDIYYCLFQVVCHYAGNVTAVTSIRTNPLLIAFESSLDTDSCFEDALQSVIATSRSYRFELFEQFLLYIAGHNQYSSYAPRYLRIYSFHPLASPSLLHRLLEIQSLFDKPSVCILRALLDFPTISSDPQITNIVLLYAIHLLHHHQEVVCVLEMTTRTFVARKPAMNAKSAVLLCALGLHCVVDDYSPFLWERSGWLLERGVNGLREQGVPCEERVVRCLMCLLSQCRPEGLKALAQVVVVESKRCKKQTQNTPSRMSEWRDPSLALVHTLIDQVDEEWENEEAMPDKVHPYYLFYLFSREEKTVQAILETSLFTHHSRLPIYLYVYDPFISHTSSSSSPPPPLLITF